jgi:hypothetical protein
MFQIPNPKHQDPNKFEFERQRIPARLQRRRVELPPVRVRFPDVAGDGKRKLRRRRCEDGIGEIQPRLDARHGVDRRRQRQAGRIRSCVFGFCDRFRRVQSGQHRHKQDEQGCETVASDWVTHWHFMADPAVPQTHALTWGAVRPSSGRLARNPTSVPETWIGGGNRALGHR